MKPIKILAAILAFAFMLVLAACGSHDTLPASAIPARPSVPGSVPTGESRAEPPAAETPSAPAAESEPYVFTGETHVEIDGRCFTLEDVPENYAEDVLVRHFLHTITQEFDEQAANLPDTEVFAIDIENQKESVATGKYIQSYVIHDISTLPEEPYAQESTSDTETLYMYQRVVEEYALQELEVIHVNFTQTYSPALNAGAPQWGEGTHDRNFIVGKAAGDAGYLIYDFGMMH